MKNYPKTYQELRVAVRRLAEVQPAVMGGFGRMHAGAVTDGVLPTSTKELVALGIAIAVRCDGCIAYHIADALRAGAKHDEIAEAIGVAVMMGGGPAVIYGAQALEALRQFEAAPKGWMSDAA